jgi:hypothetical protein
MPRATVLLLSLIYILLFGCCEYFCRLIFSVIIDVSSMILVLQNSYLLIRSRLHTFCIPYPCLNWTFVKLTLDSSCSAMCSMSFNRQAIQLRMYYLYYREPFHWDSLLSKYFWNRKWAKLMIPYLIMDVHRTTVPWQLFTIVHLFPSIFWALIYRVPCSVLICRTLRCHQLAMLPVRVTRLPLRFPSSMLRWSSMVRCFWIKLGVDCRIRETSCTTMSQKNQRVGLTLWSTTTQVTRLA